MTGLVATLLSAAVLAAFALTAGGLWQIYRGKNLKQGLLMILAAAVTLGNVLIWTL